MDVAKLITAVVTPYVTPTVTVTATASTIALGATDSFTVTVAGTPGTPSGTAQFYDGSTALGSAVTLSSGGTATLTSPAFTTAGAHSITAQYSGDTVFIATTSSAYSLTVGQAASTVTLTTSATTLVVGQAPTLTATVTGSFGTPTGTVQFLANGSNFGTAQALNTSGVATLSTQSFSSIGAYSMTAKYNGNTNYATATSTATTINVTSSSISPYYTLAPASSTLTIASPGATTGNTDTITATSVNSFAGTVPLTCLVAYTGSGTSSDLPACVLAPTSVALSANGTATSVVTITTTAAHAVRSGGSAKLMLGAGGVLACMLLCLPLRRRRISLLFALLAVLALGSGLSGCGAGGTPPVSSDPGTTLGSYTVTVMGTYSSIATPISFTLTLN